MYSIILCFVYCNVNCVSISIYVEIYKTKKHMASAIIWVRFIVKYTKVIFHDFKKYSLCMFFPGGTRIKNPSANAGDIKRQGFSSWVRKIPWMRA